MKLYLQLSLLLVLDCFHFGCSLAPPKLEDPSSMFQKAPERAIAFFKTAGKPLVEYVHSSLRAKSSSALHDHATAHFEFFSDDKCTVPQYMLDLKINRCSKYGNFKPTIVDELLDSYVLSLQFYDDSCESPSSEPTLQMFSKNSCTLSTIFGTYMTFNLNDHPKKSILGGGAAFVYYDNSDDCQISKHTNLARAQMVITWRANVCTPFFIGFMKVGSCNLDSFNYNIYSDPNCFPADFVGTTKLSTDPAILACPIDYYFKLPFQVLCVANSG
jgi:hypothetical protein